MSLVKEIKENYLQDMFNTFRSTGSGVLPVPARGHCYLVETITS
jgi:hypothetical protein